MINIIRLELWSFDFLKNLINHLSKLYYHKSGIAEVPATCIWFIPCLKRNKIEMSHLMYVRALHMNKFCSKSMSVSPKKLAEVLN